jgi:phosphate transport system substrate-binding protein
MRCSHLAIPLAVAGLTLAACGSSSSSSSSATGGGGGSSTTATSSTPTVSCPGGTVTASGSTALQPLVQKAATEYQTKCAGSTVTVSGGGSSTGLSNVAAGTSDIGDSDVPVSQAKSIDPTTVTDHQVAVVIFGVVVNPKTNVTALTTQQVQDVFSGKVTNWKDVGGADLAVTLIERKPGSGTRLTFDKTLMGSATELANPASTQDSTQLVVSGVQTADGGVSYLNVASKGTLTAVTIDGASPTAADVAGGKYVFFSHEHMYTKGAGSAAAQDFINFILSDAFQGEVTGLGFIPAAQTTKQSAIDAA